MALKRALGRLYPAEKCTNLGQKYLIVGQNLFKNYGQRELIE